MNGKPLPHANARAAGSGAARTVPISSLLSIQEPEPRGSAPAAGARDAEPGVPWLRLGFRPFYLLAAAAAAAFPLLWAAAIAGLLPLEPALPSVLWHGHEMIFGVVTAVIVGFLFTAGKTWTGLPTPTGPWLGAFALLWLAARGAGLWAPPAWFIAVDLAFLPLVAAVFVGIVARARNWRNLPMAVLLMLMAAANAAFHAAHRGLLPVGPGPILQAAVLLVVAVMSIVGGRVIPAFIGNAVPGSRPRVHAGVERLVLPLTALALLGWMVAPRSGATALVLIGLALLHAVRMLLWQPWVTRGRPILWILPAAYAWIPAGLALLGLASLGWLNASVGIHALTAGAMGGLVVGMMSRTSRGHTGRLLQAGLRERWAYGLVLAGAAVRVVAPAFDGSAQLAALVAAAALWSGAFAVLFVTLWPWLTRPRVDGKPG